MSVLFNGRFIRYPLTLKPRLDRGHPSYIRPWQYLYIYNNDNATFIISLRFTSDIKPSVTGN